ncbi:MAG: aminotransferase class V-fold PLP-dependent enzyme [Candidatus Eremiobacteraeota bacterium]|nr:aminotransferase class V-fold PLP-dependent enzyme [Candidatus Eremiobacteraeota bacterium]
MLRTLASDNAAPAHPLILQAIEQANHGHAVSYGDDAWTRRANEHFRKVFGKDIEVYFTFNGTGANVVALTSLLRTYEAVICPASAHLNTDECGAFERFAGCKLLPVQTADGKLRVADLAPFVHSSKEEHHVQPRIISISQSTEYGGLYEPAELRDLCTFAHKHNLLVHVDGARIANAAAALDCSLAQITVECGVDVLSFGGTKNGLLYGEAIVYFGGAGRLEGARYVRKQAMQLASKMRYIAAQFDTLLTDDLWLSNARHANDMAKRLEAAVRTVPDVTITRPVQCNAIFATLPPGTIRKLQEQFFFYVFDELNSEVRWMTTYETTQDDLSRFVSALRAIAGT